QSILRGLEFYRAVEIRLIDFPIGRRPLQLDPLRVYRLSSTSLTQRDNPCEAHIYQQRRLLLMRQQPEEPDREFVAPFEQTDFLWTSELFIARRPLYCVPERPRRAPRVSRDHSARRALRFRASGQ